MGQVLHRSATTTAALRGAIQHTQEPEGAGSAAWHQPQGRCQVEEARLDCRSPDWVNHPKSTVLSVEQEAILVAFRKHTLLPLDDCLYALQPTIPQLTRSSLHRCLERHGISRLPDVEGDKPRRKKTLLLRHATTTQSALVRLHRSLQLRQPTQNTTRPHTLRSHL